ncbi:hypothetical protein E2C01_102328 [Portunus trituberculatus]|uniref:Uncharacterized protein n=1 Tax=Portunus trituberculatus TaxID=210409 RepID=A0A5B7KI35_PORTR|nr:hypothetical protein [Portunus trituberculatus]
MNTASIKNQGCGLLYQSCREWRKPSTTLMKVEHSFTHELYGRWTPFREVVIALVPRPSTSHTAVSGSTRVQDPKERTRNGAGCTSEEKAERDPAVTRI